ncbi:diguanylate cyclase, partial [Kineococcus sp. T13]|nr:diguanylate cyclase [Kineococcus vitellinus]
MRLVQASAGAARDAEELQDALQDGPCGDALRSAALVVEEDLGSRLERWPEFTVHAASQGLHAVASVPLVARGEVWGALDLFRALPGPFAAQDLETAQVLAEVACGYVLAAHDRDQARRAQQRAAHAATHDPLTGLPNRVLLVDRLAHAVATAQRHGSPLAVLFLDLDGFKQVNDTHGHHVGDLLLVEVARRLGAAVRVEDTVARLGGDEFVVVCEDLPAGDAGGAGGVSAGSLSAVLARIRAAMTRPALLAGVRVRVGVSIGVAVTSPSRAVSPAGHVDEVLRTADRAMYRAKRRARE